MATCTLDMNKNFTYDEPHFLCLKAPVALDLSSPSSYPHFVLRSKSEAALDGESEICQFFV